MHFKISKKAQAYFDNIIRLEGYKGSDSNNKFLQFDVYYCCALVGIAAGQRDDNTADFQDIIDKYPAAYFSCRAQIAGLIVTAESRRLGIDLSSPELETVLLSYLSSNNTLLSDDGVKALNAYSLKGYHLIEEQLMCDKPLTREEFLDAFNMVMHIFSKKRRNDDEKSNYT